MKAVRSNPGGLFVLRKTVFVSLSPLLRRAARNRYRADGLRPAQADPERAGSPSNFCTAFSAAGCSRRNAYSAQPDKTISANGRVVVGCTNTAIGLQAE